MNNDSVEATYDDEVVVYTDPDHDPAGQRQISLVSDTWYPGTCEVKIAFLERCTASCPRCRTVVRNIIVVALHLQQNDGLPVNLLHTQLVLCLVNQLHDGDEMPELTHHILLVL